MNAANTMLQCPQCKEKRFPNNAVEFSNYAHSPESYYDKEGIRYIYVYCEQCYEEARDRYVRDLLTISTHSRYKKTWAHLTLSQRGMNNC